MVKSRLAWPPLARAHLCLQNLIDQEYLVEYWIWISSVKHVIAWHLSGISARRKKVFLIAKSKLKPGVSGKFIFSDSSNSRIWCMCLCSCICIKCPSCSHVHTNIRHHYRQLHFLWKKSPVIFFYGEATFSEMKPLFFIWWGVGYLISLHLKNHT